MTGFGYAEGKGNLGVYRVYVKSVNHRFLEIALRLPRELSLWEEKINEAVRQYASRGKIELRVDFEPCEGAFTVTVHTALAQAYLEALRKLSCSLSLPFEPKIEWLIEIGNIVEVQEDTEVWLEEWERFSPVLHNALQAFFAYRVEEGKKLCADLQRQLAEAEAKVQDIEARSERVREYYFEKLLKRVREIVPQEKIDEALLLQEVLFYTDRSDIHEEIVRLRAHIARVRNLLTRDGVVGRELEFVLQEMHREVNTIGAKSPDSEISSLVVDMKTLLERMREQVHNVE
ncbi:MAG: YicC family protein [Candidatus Caldatribacterium sp.]|uniref:YicC/YloC family endoribonuclease n=1 Tax=Candidatus Caldatribacterium sp. TaxID=2282143 RepID=UPI00299865AE|nr:YicC family protein [Candidatus Caldatribacterium sp.]MCX7730253.1 YicC family protein [Candidatus Caldatribacterium sp.]MDW8080464.1 YicC/YloC family endoribonuclease [Candidatus Calescibacterium sp.]